MDWRVKHLADGLNKSLKETAQFLTGYYEPPKYSLPAVSKGTEDIQDAQLARARMTPEQLQAEELAGVEGSNKDLALPSSPFTDGSQTSDLKAALGRRAEKSYGEQISKIKQRSREGSQGKVAANLSSAAGSWQMKQQKDVADYQRKLAQHDAYLQARHAVISNVFGFAGMAAGAMVGGPAGAQVGQQVGKSSAGQQPVQSRPDPEFQGSQDMRSSKVGSTAGPNEDYSSKSSRRGSGGRQ